MYFRTRPPDAMMLRGLVFLPLLVHFTACDFWSRAATTSDLNVLRQDEVSPTIGQGSYARIQNPLYFPLCGNGRIDTKADYQRLYTENNYPSMSFPSKAFKWVTQTNQADSPEKMYDVNLMVDEVCDDGNREDLDGCSGDCLFRDVWTSSCEIAMERQLEYEDLAPVPNTADMVASALDGVYLLGKINRATRFQSAALLCTKNFPVSNIVHIAHSRLLFMYSSVQQRIWKMDAGALTIQSDFSSVLNPWQGRATAMDEGASALIIQDAHTLLMLEKTDFSIISQCTFPETIDKTCFFASKTRTKASLRCDSIGKLFSIRPGSTPVCLTEQGYANKLDGKNIWVDLANTILIGSPSIELNKLRGMQSSISPPYINGWNWEYKIDPLRMRVLFPMGLWMEAILSSPRDLVNQQYGLTYGSVGDSSIVAWMLPKVGVTQSCGPSKCMFDIPVGYNPFSAKPNVNTRGYSWEQLLQGLVDEELKADPPKTNLYDLWNDKDRYRRLVDNFVAEYITVTSAQAFRTVVEHPASKNLWAIQGKSLFEISLSGVQVQFSDGKCLPSNIGICPFYAWAESGQTCISCFVKKEDSLAWQASCQKFFTYDSVFGGRRRLLAIKQSGTVVFVIRGDELIIKAEWPNATRAGNETSVVLHTDDIDSTIDSINARLKNSTSISVLVPPFGIQDTNVGAIVFVIDGVNTTRITELWPLARVETSNSSTTITLATSEDPQEDMRSIKRTLAENPDLRVLVNPYLRVEMQDPPESADDILFSINGTDVAHFRMLWPRALFRPQNTSTQVTIPTSGNVTLDMQYATRSLVNLTVLVYPRRRGSAPLPVESLDDIIFLINSTNLVLLRDLWPRALFRPQNTSTQVTIPTSGNVTLDMQYATRSLVNLTVLVYPHRRGSAPPPVESPDDIIFIINSTNVTRLKELWPRAWFQPMNDTIRVTIPSSGNSTLDLKYATQPLTNLVVLVEPYQRAAATPLPDDELQKKAETIFGAVVNFIWVVVVVIVVVTVVCCVRCCCRGGNTHVVVVNQHGPPVIYHNIEHRHLPPTQAPSNQQQAPFRPIDPSTLTTTPGKIFTNVDSPSAPTSRSEP